MVRKAVAATFQFLIFLVVSSLFPMRVYSFLPYRAGSAAVAAFERFGATASTRQFTRTSPLPTLSTISSSRSISSTTRLFLSSRSYDEYTTLPRIYVGSSGQPHQDDESTLVRTNPLYANAIVSLSPYQANYLNVMRITNSKRWGELAGLVRVFDGQHGEWLAKVVVPPSSNSGKQNRRKGNLSSSGTTVVVECVECLRPQEESEGVQNNSVPATKIHLYLGLLKKARRKDLLEQVTELGVDSVTVLETAYSSKQSMSSDAWEYDKHLLHVMEASEQSERLTLPSLNSSPMVWSDFLARLEETTKASTPDQSHLWLLCRERSPESPCILTTLANKLVKGGEKNAATICCHVHVVVGPEGGWSPDELLQMDKLQKSSDQIQFVSLGNSVLKTDTAAVTAIAATALAVAQ